MSKSIYLTKKYKLNCSHIIKACADGSPGTTKETSFHGHSLDLFITIKNNVDLESGLTIERDLFDKIVQETIIDKYDRKNLNQLIEIPTGENMLKHIHRDLIDSELRPYYFQSQLKETSKNMFTSPKAQA